MAKRTAGELYQDAIAAGLSPAAAVIQTAIALASTGGDTDALLERDGTSAVGAYLTRVEPRATGTGGARDVARLAGDPRAQAASAAQISDGGRDWSAFQAWRDGSLSAFLPQAEQAAAAAGTPVTAGVGPDWAPWNVAPGQLSKARDLGLVALVVAAGLGLVVLGAGEAVMPRVKQRLQQSARVAAKVVT